MNITIGDDEICATPNHPFYVVGKGFVSAGTLSIGDIVSLVDGNYVQVEKLEIKRLDKAVKVYNFEVEDDHTYYVGTKGVLVHNKCPKIPPDEDKTSDITTGAGYGASDPPVRIDGEWTINDMKQALLGHSPRGLGNPDIHHGGQMPGGSLHEVLPNQHRNNSALHPNLYNQGVTNEMRVSDRQLHWWYRAREQGADELLPDWIYDD